MPDDPWCVRSIHSVSALAGFARDRSLSAAAVLTGTGLREQDLEDPGLEIDLTQEFQVVANILDAIGDEPGFGLLAGFSVRLPMLGSLGLAMASCATVRDMAELWVRYSALSFAYTRFGMDEAEAAVLMTLDAATAPEPLRRFAVERDLAAVRTIQRDLLSWDIPVRRVELTFPYAPVYEAARSLDSLAAARRSMQHFV
ncbi:AraC family transcriptional regulator ligand-binding domain-containing protein, partial [Nocardia sp. NPDC004722]